MSDTDAPQFTNAQALEIKIILLIKEAVDYETPIQDIMEALNKCVKHTQDIIDELEAMEDDGSRAN